MKKIAYLLVVFLLIGCGGGGGGSSGNTDIVGFTTEDFSGKSLYYVSSGGYQLGTFFSDGTARGSDLMTSGTPVLQPETVNWSVVNGELMIDDPVSGDSVRYVLLSDDTTTRYFRANKYSLGGIISVVGMFYDQITGLSQAQDFVANHRTP